MDSPRDELLDQQGRLRAPWRRMLGGLLGMGTVTLTERRRELDRTYAEEGATALLAGQQAAAWRCDPVPFLFTEAEFADVTAALAQRATLLEAILVDMYGAQTALASGIIPPALVYPDPAYLRACRCDKPGRQLHLYAADLFRDPDGAWRVLADRTAEPGGLAHALENRRMMARVLPELFRQADIAPLRPFFDAMQDSLQRLAPAGNPGLALLTPGHTDPGWFEHVILARELGCALVEDGDLTVRDGAVWVKTLRGLSPVHVLLRHQNGSSMDPLDLNEDAGTGIPGLFCAMRDGSVRVLNAPGAGFAQSPGLMPFLPVLARHFLHAELALPSIETIWLGDAAAQARVRGNPGDWRILPVHGGIADLAPSMAEKPWGFVAMPPVKPSVAPCLGAGDVLEPYGIIVRLFLLWDGQGWRPLPGGVARVADPGRRIAKDVWVLTEEGADIVGPGNLPVPAMAVRRMAGDLPSRVADNFFWLGRYLERLENVARLTRAMLARLGRAALTPRDMPDFVALAACLAEAGMLNPDIGAGAGPAVLADQLRRALAADQGPAGRLTGRVQTLADTLRDRLSGEMHTAITHGLRGLKGARLALAPGVRGRQSASLGLMADFAGRILEFSATVSGYAAENMVRGGGRLFLDLGRRVERAQSTALHLAFALDQKPDRAEAGLSLALELCDSTLTYRARYLSVLQPATVLDLVLTDEGNPRSLAFQLAAARATLAALEGQADGGLAVLLDAPLAELRLMVSELLGAADQSAVAATLPDRLRAISAQAGATSTAVSRQYFTLLPPTWTERVH
jgi:uncharacterized circularly permuted ATP-grasp superfamily protein/uncharacterized alpha-E superfamily protein